MLKIKSFRSFTESEEDEHLYHATYRTNKDNIELRGLLSNYPQKNWSDSKSGRIYLAKDPEEALSHAESAENVPDEHYNSGIVVYKINKKKLDPQKIFKDENNPDADTVEYHGDIHPNHMVIHSEHDT